MDEFGLIKLTDAYKSLHRDAESGRVRHAYLIVSPDAFTASALADIFAAELMFGESDSQSVRRAAKSGSDIIRLPHGDKVLTADAEELLDTVYYTPTEHDRKLYIISRAETMNESSQNKLLKVLEEPPAHVVIIMCATTKSLFLPTVMSRVSLVEAGPIPERDLVKYLSDAYGGERARAAYELSGGFLGKAVDAAEGSGTARLLDLAFGILTGMKNSRYVLEFSARVMIRKDDVGELLSLVEAVLSDGMAVSCGRTESVRFSARTDELFVVAAEYPPEAVVRLRPVFARARARLALNGNIQSVVDEFLFALTEVKAKCRK